MTSPASPIVIANWKMYGSRALVRDWVAGLRAGLLPDFAPATLIACPPMPLIAQLGAALSDVGLAQTIRLGAQDCHALDEGAETGDTSARLLAELGCSHVLVGHSERRRSHGEGDQIVAAKALAARRHGLVPVVCVGEDRIARDADRAEATVTRQVLTVLESLDPAEGPTPIIAYEPVWAIGAPQPAGVPEIAAMHGAIRRAMLESDPRHAAVPIIYGGACTAASVRAIMGTGVVQGVLCGRAGLDPASLLAILREIGAGRG